MIDRVQLSEETLQKTDDQLKMMSGADLASLFCQIVKAPTAPKFADKKSAIKRIRQMAQQVVSDKQTLIDTSKLLDKKQSSKVGRPLASKKVYTFLSGYSEDNFKRLPKQAKAIIKAIDPDVKIPEAELKGHIMTLAKDNVLTTKQDPWRIFQYYRAAMINSSMLRMNNAE
jgi:hypothetical protein